jgi:leucyl-tRNA synthetase
MNDQLTAFQDTLKDRKNLRTGPKDSFHDKVFAAEMDDLINISQEHYEQYVHCKNS